MANELLTAGIGDLFASEVAAAEYGYLLADRADFFGHPALVYVPNPGGSNVVKYSFVGLDGYNLPADGTEGTAEANTALTDASASITIGWKVKQYEQSDLARIVSNGKIDPMAYARDAAVSTAQKLVDMIAALAGGFSNYVGSSGVDCTFTNITDAITQLEISKASGPYLAVLHPRQWGDLRTASLSLGGAVQHRFDAQGVASAGGQYKGTLFGVDFFCTSHVDTANSAADRAGMMIAPGAILWSDMEVPNDGDPNQLHLGRVMLERDRTPKAALTAYVSHSYLGVIEGIDAAGCGIVTDA